MTAAAGTPLAQVEAELAECRQELAFEPADYGAILGGEPGRQTIGGVFACNLAGPRRIKAGAARDHLLGLHCVTGQGTAIKTGGRVVKNVTGYDLCKLLTGSYGTLAVLSDVTFKVLPRAETEGTLLLIGRLSPSCSAAPAGRRAPRTTSCAACLPPWAAGRSSVPAVRRAGRAMAAVRSRGQARRSPTGWSSSRPSSRVPARWCDWATATAASCGAKSGTCASWSRAARCGGCRCRRRRRASSRAGPRSSRKSAWDWAGGLLWLAPRNAWADAHGTVRAPSPAAAATRPWSARTRSCAGRCRPRAPATAAGAPDPPGEGELRPQAHPQPRPDVRGPMSAGGAASDEGKAGSRILRLYHLSLCPLLRKIRIALREKGLSWSRSSPGSMGRTSWR